MGMPKKSKPAKRTHGGRAQIGGSPQGPIYKQKPPMERGVHAASTTTSPTTLKRPKVRAPNTDFVQATPVPATPFELREDGSIIPGTPHPDPLPAGEGIINPAWRKSEAVSIRQTAAKISPSPGGEGRGDLTPIAGHIISRVLPLV